MKRRLIIGNKRFGFYLRKVRELLNRDGEVEVQAAGRNLRKLVDICEVLKREGVRVEEMWTETREIEIGRVSVMIVRLRK